MRANRLLSILLMLQARGRLTAQELADELEVSVRTMYRDLEALGGAGVPVFAERGPSGGYQLLDGYRTRLTGLTGAEAESLFLVGLPGPAAELGLGTVVAAAQLKLMAALPPELRSRASRIQERFHLDAPGWFHDADQPPYLAAVADAVWNQRAVGVCYRSWRDEVTRTLEPLGLVLKGGVWYLVARVAGQVRTYRVSSILELEVLEAHFARPEGFDLTEFWSSASEQFQASLYQGEAVVRLSARGRALLPMLFEPVTARAASEGAGPPDQDGWSEVVLPIESLRHAEIQLLQLGAEAEVVAPAELRDRVAEVARAMVRLYGCSELLAISRQLSVDEAGEPQLIADS